jgi:hypothetical protein
VTGRWRVEGREWTVVSRKRNGSLTLAILLAAMLGGLAGCAPVRPTAPWQPPAVSGPYTANARFLFEARGKTASFRGGCAVDPGQGLRLEVRDPMGSTRLLLILLPHPTGVLLLDPARKVHALWSLRSPSLPWVPDTLWLVLSGEPPFGAEISRSGEDRLDLRWTVGDAVLKGSLRPSHSGPAPFTEVEVRSRGVHLKVSLSDVKPQPMAPAALESPDLETYKTVELWDVLSGGGP